MTTKRKIEDITYILDSFEDDVSMVGSLALYSNDNVGLAVIFVEEDSFFGLIGLDDKRRGTKKHFEWTEFIHLEDSDLCSYPFLSEQKAEQIPLNFRLVKEDASVVIVPTELEKIHFSSTDKIIVFKTTVHDTKSLMTQNVIERTAIHNFSSMLYYSYDFIYFKNLHHAFTASSQTMANITGYSSGDEHIGLTDYDIFPKEHADIYYRLESQILEGEKDSIKQIEPYYDENRNKGFVDSRKYPIKDEHGKIIGLFGISRIVTEELLSKRKLEETQEELKKLANQDSLTLLHNRRRGHELCNQAIALANRYKHSLSLIIFDADHFKNVNDNYGHDCGDDVLRQIADIMRDVTRDTDIAFRFGGEEFVICTPHETLSGAFNLMERINSMLKLSPSPCTGFSITVSAGIAQWKNGESIDQLVKRADEQLYKAKEAGRDCIKY